jgi:hypothetical protein
MPPMHAAEGRDLGRDDALVDADDTVFGRLGRPTDPALLTLTIVVNFNNLLQFERIGAKSGRKLKDRSDVINLPKFP